MFVKITTSGPPAVRQARGSLPRCHRRLRQRIIATLGRVESIRAGEADSLVNGLLRAAGKPTLEQGTGAVDFAPPAPSATPGCSPPCGKSWALPMRFAGYCAIVAGSMLNACCA
ncbi:MAG: hypothetical protein IPN00_14285 [Hydrogenophilales bacterium]|nr:hypothetical protein [Hydrogenophilales bacterium]